MNFLPVFLLVLIAVSNNGYANTAKVKLQLSGSSTVAPLMVEIANKYEQLHPNIRIDIQTGGSTRGIADINRKISDIGMVSRDLKTKEKDLKSFTIAKDGIAMITHKLNPVTALSPAEIKNIYLGKISDWEQVTSYKGEIIVVNKAEGRSTLELFLKHFKLKNRHITADVIIGDNQQGIKTISANQYGIGYVSIGAARYAISQGVPIKMLPLNGVQASLKNVLNGLFPLSRPLNLVTSEEPSGAVKDFITYALSKDVNHVIESQYFVPLH